MELGVSWRWRWLTLAGDTPIHLSFDVDALDPMWALRPVRRFEAA